MISKGIASVTSATAKDANNGNGKEKDKPPPTLPSVRLPRLSDRDRRVPMQQVMDDAERAAEDIAELSADIAQKQKCNCLKVR